MKVHFNVSPATLTAVELMISGEWESGCSPTCPWLDLMEEVTVSTGTEAQM